MDVQSFAKNIVHVDVGLIKPHPLNANKHSKEQIDRLAKIIKYSGFRQPLVVSNQSGLLISGHGRLEAAKQICMAQVPVIYEDFADEAMEFQHLTADNAIASWAELDLDKIKADALDLQFDTNGFDLDLLGIPELDLSVPDPDKEATEDDVPEVSDRTISKLGDIYELGEHRLLCGDSTDKATVERLFSGSRAEICFTSPPYADQREYNGGKELSTEHLAKIIKPEFANYYCVNLGYSRKNGEINPYWDDYIKHAKTVGLKLISWNVWNKGECGSIGNQTAMFGISHEWIFVFGREPKALNRTVENSSAGYLANHNGNRQADGTVKKQKDRIVGSHSQLKTVYDCVPQKERDDIDHPARFPVRFPEGYIEAMTDKNQSVYEPFGGSGSTLIACEKTKRKCFMMELDPHYVDVIVSRWVKYTGKTSITRNGEPMEWTV